MARALAHPTNARAVPLPGEGADIRLNSARRGKFKDLKLEIRRWGFLQSSLQAQIPNTGKYFRCFLFICLQEIEMKRRTLMFVTLLLLCSTTILAKPPEKKVIKADTPEKFALVVEAVREQMAPGKRYEFLNAVNRATVNHSLDTMAEMLQRAGSVDALSQEDKTRLFSIQESVNGILVKNADDRLVCSHRPPTGSHIPMTECKTVRELALRREAEKTKQKQMEDGQRALDAASDGDTLRTTH